MNGNPAAITALRRGLIWFVIGGAVIMVVHALRISTPDPLLRWGPLLPMFAGAYGVVAGAEKMFSGLRAGRTLTAPDLRRRHRGWAAICAIGVIAVIGAGWAVWSLRAPYWDAVAGLHDGDRATIRLREIGQRHADALAAQDHGPEALETWRRTAEEGGGLRPSFARALESARALARTTSGRAKASADIDVRYYTLCLEWMDLFDRIRHAFETQSLADPPLEWAEEYDGIIARIQRVNEAAAGD